MTIFFDFLRPPPPKNSPNFSACGGLKSLGGTTSNPPASSLKKKALGLGGGGVKTVGGISTGEIFGEEFSHFFMTNFFDLHPQKKPKIFPPAAEKIIGGDDPPIPPKKISATGGEGSPRLKIAL